MKHGGPSSLASLVQSFFREYLVEQRQASPQTIAAYRDGLRLLFVFAAQRRKTTPSGLILDHLDRDTVLAFLNDLETTRNNSARTRNARLAAVRAFFRHVAYRDPAALAIVERILTIRGKRTHKAVISYLTREELDAVLAAPDRTTATGRRWHGLLLFLARTGARVSEATRVSVADLNLQDPRQVLLHGKGSKDRVIPLDRNTASVLHLLPGGVPDQNGIPVFTNARGERLSRHGAFHLVRQAAQRASGSCRSLGHKRISPHTMRHTLAMQLLQAGVDLIVIQSWLGHAFVTTTHGYVEADVEMKRRALERGEIIVPESEPFRPADSLLELLESL
jgi:integrase/recombinase XerD